MKRKVSFNVDPRALPGVGGPDYTFHTAATHAKEELESIGCHVPDTRYNVTYALAPKTGKWFVKYYPHRCFLLLLLVGETSPIGRPIVCQLPHEWDGMRVNRTVKLLENK